ncbi:PREDICTED: uncharacterized protein LOC104547175, partial [Mesitornis unicolor]
MAERRAGAKGRRMGSSRRKQLREGYGGDPATAPGPSEAPATAPSPSETPARAPGPTEGPLWASEIVQRVQELFRDKDQAGFITRSDMQFLSSQKATSDHRRRKTASRRVRLVLPSPLLEDSEEQRHFAAFMAQLGIDNTSEDCRQEIWQLWVKLRQDEPQLLGNLEGFLARMKDRIQEARSKKEALEVTLNKRVAEHDQEVQQLCQALEQQIQQEQQRLEQESMVRSHQHSVELQQALDASEREVQRLVTAQMELETRCRSLRSSQQATSTENRQLEESNRALQDHLQHLHQQLQQTQGRLRTARATVAGEHAEEPRGRTVVVELPGVMPLSPQTSPERSEKYRSEMRIRLGSSQSEEPKARNTHQAVWEVLPAESSPLGALRRASSAEEDPFPEMLKEERFSDQSSLLTEMNDAIAALSQQLKPQGLGAPPRDDAEPKTGLEAATGDLQETLPGQELFGGDPKLGPAAAELGAPDVTQTGASAGAGHHGAQEPGAEQGESPEEAQRRLFPQGKGPGAEELMLKVTEHLQGPESAEESEQAVMEVEGKTGWEKAQSPGEAEEAALSQGENPEAGLGAAEAGDAGIAEGWWFAMGELGPAAAPGDGDARLGEEAEPSLGLSEKLEMKPGEHLEPQPASCAATRLMVEAEDGAQGQNEPELPQEPVLDPQAAGVGQGEWDGLGVQPPEDAVTMEVLEDQSSGAKVQLIAEVDEFKSTLGEGTETDLQNLSEFSSPGTEQGGRVAADVQPRDQIDKSELVKMVEAEDTEAVVLMLGHASSEIPQVGGYHTAVQLGEEAEDGTQGQDKCESPQETVLEPQGAGAGQGEWDDVGVQPLEDAVNMEMLEDQGSDTNVQLIAEVDELKSTLGEGTETDLQNSSEFSSLDTEQGGRVAPDVQPLDQIDKSELVEMVEAEDTQADVQLGGDASPETTQHGEDPAAIQLMKEAEDGAQGQGECVLDPQGAGAGQGEGAGAGVQPPEDAVTMEVLEDQSNGAKVQLLAEVDELKSAPGGSTGTDLQLLMEADTSRTEQGGRVAPDVQPLDQADEPELVEMVEGEDTQVDIQMLGHASPEIPQGGGNCIAIHLREEAEDVTQGQDEHESPQKPVLDLQGAGAGQGEGAGVGVQSPEDAVTMEVLEDESNGANVQLIAKVDELKSTPRGRTETDLQPPSLSEARSSGTEQGGSVAPDVQPLDQVDKPELVEMVEAEDTQTDTQLGGDASPETLQHGEDPAAVQLMEEAEDGQEGQGERVLLHKPVLQLHGVDIRQGEGADGGVQPREEAENLDTPEDQGTDAHVQVIAEVDELKLTPGGSMETDLQSLREAGYSRTEQGGSVAPDVQPRDQADEPELVKLEIEDAQADMQLRGGDSTEAPWGEEAGAATQLEEEAEDGTQEQDEPELPQELVLDLQGAGVGQGEGAGVGVQPPEDAVTMEVLEDQGSGANVQLIAEVDELKSTLGEGTETDLQNLSEFSSLDTEQGGRVAPDVQPLDQVDEPELVETEEGENTQADIQMLGHARPEIPQGGGNHIAIHLREEAEDVTQGQDEHESPQKPVLDLQGAGAGQGEGAGVGVQPPEDAVTMEVLEDQGCGANVQVIAEVDELKSAPRGSMETDLQPVREQGGSMGPDVHPLAQVDKPEVVEMVMAEDTQADMLTLRDASPEALQGGGYHTAVHLREEVEDGAQGQDERELSQEPVLDPQGAGVGQGEGAGVGVQPPEDAVTMEVLEDQSADTNVQLLTEAEELKPMPGGSTGADLASLGTAGMKEGEQSPNSGWEAGLGTAPTADVWEGAAAVPVPPPPEPTSYPEGAPVAEGPGLGMELGAPPVPDGQIPEDTQTLELLQGEGAAAEGRPLDGAQGLGAVQGERLEAQTRSSGETEVPGIKQDHDAGASALSLPVPKVPLPISVLKLETLMQEDVLVPDVQTAQSELQEQVPAQADKVKLHTASQKLPQVMETEQVSAKPAQPPKEEVPPASTIHVGVRQEEDAGSDQLGTVLRDGSLGDAANSRMQLSGEESKDLDVGQREKQQEVGRKTNWEGEPSPGEPGAMAADGAGGSPAASLDPDHLYNVLFVGDSHVGKTTFLYRLHADTFNPHLTATVGLDYRIKNLVVDNKRFALRLWDSAGQERYRSVTKQFFRRADGVVLMYDITSGRSFSDVRYWMSCVQEGAEDGVAVLLLGNKTDCATERQVPTEEGERLAK